MRSDGFIQIALNLVRSHFLTRTALTFATSVVTGRTEIGMVVIGGTWTTPWGMGTRFLGEGGKVRLKRRNINPHPHFLLIASLIFHRCMFSRALKTTGQLPLDSNPKKTLRMNVGTHSVPCSETDVRWECRRVAQFTRYSNI